MSTIFVFANNASSVLASGILAADTTLTVASSDGALFPALSSGHACLVTLQDVGGNKEIVKVTARTGDVLTMVRAQEATTARDFASGSRVECRLTAGLLAALLQKNGGDTLSGTTTVTGVIDLGSGGSIQGGEYAGPVRSAAGVTAGEIKVVGGVPKSGTATILTDANLLATMPAGLGLMETGMICLWSGSSGSVPSGYHVCDGTSGTPDLRDKFVLGAGGSLPSTGGATSGTTSTSAASGTIDPHTLSLAEVPAHGHRVWSCQNNLEYTSAAPTDIVGPAAGNVSQNYYTNTGHGTGGQPIIEQVGGGGSHTHGFTGTTHSHTVATVPPYRALFYIMKL